MSGALQAVFQNQRSFVSAPDAPTIGVATVASPTIATVTFTAPAKDGGSAITGYTVTSSPGGITATGTTPSITISGLTTNTAYTFTVTATNAIGTGPASAASNSITPVIPTTIGQAWGGGYYAGQIGIASTATHYLVVGPKASAEGASKQFKTTSTNDAGALSDINGPSNSSSMNDSSHPAALFCEGLTIGGLSDWYMPAKNELEVCYYNLKPYNNSNNTSSAINLNAVPARASNYSSGTPGQTSATAFRVSGGEDFNGDKYWSSTQRTAAYGWPQSFYTGYQNPYEQKYFSRWVRAVRRVAV